MHKRIGRIALILVVLLLVPVAPAFAGGGGYGGCYSESNSWIQLSTFLDDGSSISVTKNDRGTTFCYDMYLPESECGDGLYVYESIGAVGKASMIVDSSNKLTGATASARAIGWRTSYNECTGEEMTYPLKRKVAFNLSWTGVGKAKKFGGYYDTDDGRCKYSGIYRRQDVSGKVSGGKSVTGVGYINKYTQNAACAQGLG